jgi:hypothetical protein
MEFYYAEGNQQKGPVTVDELRSLRLPPDTLVWREGMSQWTRADGVPELTSLFAAPAAPAYEAAPGYEAASAPSLGAAPMSEPPTPTQPQAYQPQVYPQNQYQPQQPVYPQAYPQQGYPQQPGYPQAPMYPQQMGYAAPMYGAPSNAGQGLGVASMILGILALPATCFYGTGLVFAILAVIFGHIARTQSQRANGQANGMAVAGLICGYIALAIVVIAIVFMLVILGSISTMR